MTGTLENLLGTNYMITTMSTTAENDKLQDLSDPFVRFATVLINAPKDIKQSYDMLVEPSFKGNKYCSLGYSRKAAGESDLSMFMGINSATKMYGFTKEQRYQIRRCPEADCCWTAPLGGMVAHLNDHHKIPIQIVGKLVLAIRDDKRPEPKLIERVQLSIKFATNYIKSK